MALATFCTHNVAYLINGYSEHPNDLWWATMRRKKETKGGKRENKILHRARVEPMSLQKSTAFKSNALTDCATAPFHFSASIAASDSYLHNFAADVFFLINLNLSQTAFSLILGF
jgi:hypothetical protein